MFKVRNMPKPQLNFKEKISNDSTPFLHKLTEKPHCLNPKSLCQRDSHPYEFELKNFSPNTKFLTIKNDVPQFKPVSSTPLIMVDTKDAFDRLLQDLLLQTVIGVDLEVIMSSLWILELVICKPVFLFSSIMETDPIKA